MTSHDPPPEGLPIDLSCDGTGRAKPSALPAFPDALRRVVAIVTIALADPDVALDTIERCTEWLGNDLMVLAEALAPDGIMADDLGGVWWGEPEAEGSHRVATIARHDGEQLTYRILMDMGWRLVTANDLETLLTLAYSAAGHADTLGLDMDLHDRPAVLHRIRESVLVQQAAAPPWHVHDPSAEETARRVMASVEEIRKQVDHLLALARSASSPVVPTGNTVTLPLVDAAALGWAIKNAVTVDPDSPLGWAMAHLEQAIKSWPLTVLADDVVLAPRALLSRLAACVPTPPDADRYTHGLLADVARVLAGHEVES